MLETYLRPTYQRFLVDPLAQLIHLKWQTVSPMSLTVCAMLSGIVSMLLLMMSQPAMAVLFLLLSGYFDTLDGTVARMRGVSSDKGAVLDIVSDRVVEFAIIFGLFMVAPDQRGIAAMLMLGSSLICITSFLVVGIFSNNNSQKGFHYSVGLMERAEAFLFFIVMMLVPAWFVSLAAVYVVLVLYTAIKRVKQFLD